MLYNSVSIRERENKRALFRAHSLLGICVLRHRVQIHHLIEITKFTKQEIEERLDYYKNLGIIDYYITDSEVSTTVKHPLILQNNGLIMTETSSSVILSAIHGLLKLYPMTLLELASILKCSRSESEILLSYSAGFFMSNVRRRHSGTLHLTDFAEDSSKFNASILQLLEKKVEKRVTLQTLKKAIPLSESGLILVLMHAYAKGMVNLQLEDFVLDFENPKKTSGKIIVEFTENGKQLLSIENSIIANGAEKNQLLEEIKEQYENPFNLKTIEDSLQNIFQNSEFQKIFVEAQDSTKTIIKERKESKNGNLDTNEKGERQENEDPDSLITYIDKEKIYRRDVSRSGKVELRDLPEPERTAAGFILLTRETSFYDLARLSRFEAKEVPAVLSRIMRQSKFDAKELPGGLVRLSESTILPIVESIRKKHDQRNLNRSDLGEVSGLKTLQEFQSSSYFNYRALVGLLKTYSEIDVRDISEKLDELATDVIDALIELVLQAILDAHLTLGTKLIVKQINPDLNTDRVHIDDWQITLMGMLMIYRGRLELVQIIEVLGENAKRVEQQVYEFLTQDFFPCKFNVETKTLESLSIPDYNPLVGRDQLTLIHLVVLGYMSHLKHVNVKEMSKYLERDQKVILKTIYELTGYGYMKPERYDKQTLFMREVKKIDVPKKRVEDLPPEMVRVLAYLRAQQNDPKKQTIKYGNIAKALNFSKVNVVEYLCLLVFYGFLRGYLNHKSFYWNRQIYEPKSDKFCRFCGSPLTKDGACVNCGRDSDVCIICRENITDGQFVSQCPSCYSIGHRKHMQIWVSKAKKCSVCKVELMVENLLTRRRV